jgi:deazaflavin-dependent oxidoreductase (nitroreductase family)
MENKPIASPSGRGRSPITFMNKIINPMVGLILRSPLHGLMSGSLLIISCCGRKTGREYHLPVQYAQAGKILYIVPGMPEQKTWWRNLKEAAPVKLTLRGRSVAGNAVVLKADSDAEAILEGFGVFLRRFPAMAKANSMRAGADESFNAEELREAAAKAVIIRVKLG